MLHWQSNLWKQFQRRSYAKLRWFHSGKKGYGLQLQEDVTEGRFLIEYVGEVILLSVIFPCLHNPTFKSFIIVSAMIVNHDYEFFWLCTVMFSQVLDIMSHESRQRYYASKGQKHFYFMALNGGEVLSDFTFCPLAISYFLQIYCFIQYCFKFYYLHFLLQVLFWSKICILF